MSINSLSLDDVITVGLTCLEQSIDSKEEVKRTILDAVKKEFQKEEKWIEDISVSVFVLLHNSLGIDFETGNGKIADVLVRR